MLDDGNDVYPDFVNPFPVGRPLSYTPRGLAEKFAEYIEWAKEHPIVIGETERGIKSGKGTDATKIQHKPRLISIEGFLVYLGKRKSWWQELENGKHGPEFLYLKQLIREYCESYQKEMASAGIFNANIISRLLGLAEKQEIEASVQGVTVNVGNDETKKILQDIIDKDRQQ